MKTKIILKSGMKVMDPEQLSKIKGGKIIYIVISGQRIPIEVPN